MEIVEVGSLPPLGIIPEFMYAQVLRPKRYGPPSSAFEIEKIKTPEIAPDEVLVAVKSAGLNYNSVWAALAYPVDMIALMNKRGDSAEKFQILGSDCSGIIYKVGDEVTDLNVGDEIVVQGGWYDKNEMHNLNGGDPTVSKTFRAWGYETNFGAYAQFCKVKGFQCLPKPPHLNWDEAAVYMVSGVTAFRMLHHYAPHIVKSGDVVLVWGGAGGLGSMAIQLVKAAGAIPIAVVNSRSKQKFCDEMGVASLNREDYNHWGPLSPEALTPEKQDIWRNRAKPFFKDLLKLTNGRLPRIVIEHPGESTLPTSIYVCDTEGMVVTCAGT
ncbi:MAG: alcohol dehydrogenase catalytic domain-containing protein, partial [Chitinophagales bacterium]